MQISMDRIELPLGDDCARKPSPWQASAGKQTGLKIGSKAGCSFYHYQPLGSAIATASTFQPGIGCLLAAAGLVRESIRNPFAEDDVTWRLRGEVTGFFLSLTFMQGEDLGRWQQLCQQATSEQDPDRMLELTREILRMLTDKIRRLQGARSSSSTLRREVRVT